MSCNIKDEQSGLTIIVPHVIVRLTIEYDLSSGTPKPGSEGYNGGSRFQSGAVPQL